MNGATTTLTRAGILTVCSSVNLLYFIASSRMLGSHRLTLQLVRKSLGRAAALHNSNRNMRYLSNHHDKAPILAPICFIVLFSFLARIITWISFEFSGTLGGGDGAYYISAARNLTAHGYYGEGGAPDKFRPPMYSIWLAVSGIVDEAAAIVYIVQGVLHTVCAVIFYFSLRSVDFKMKYSPALIAATLIAASPFHALYNGRILSESLATVLMILAMIPILANYDRLPFLICSSLFFGMLVLTREIYAILPFIVCGYLLFKGVRALKVAVFLLTFLIVLTPWILRNSSLESKAPEKRVAAFWLTLWIGAWERNPEWTKRKDKLPEEAYSTLKKGTSRDELDRAFKSSDQAFFREQFVDYLQREPLAIFKNAIVRQKYLWLGTRSDLFETATATGSVSWYIIKLVLYAYNCLLLLLGAIGVVIAWRTQGVLTLAIIPIFYTSLIYFFFHSTETRYSQPALPMVELLAASVLGFIRNRYCLGVVR